MESRRQREAVCTGVRRLRNGFFDFYALLQTRFSLRRRVTGQRGTRHYVSISVTVLTALNIHLFQVEKFLSCFNAFRSALFTLIVFYAN